MQITLNAEELKALVKEVAPHAMSQVPPSVAEQNLGAALTALTAAQERSATGPAR